jgi:transposase
VLATLAGGYRLSKRPSQQLVGDLFGLSIATGMVSKPSGNRPRCWKPLQRSGAWPSTTPTRSASTTPRGENRGKARLWVVLTAVTTVFTIAAKRSGAVAKALLGQVEPGGHQRPTRSFEWIDPAWRQICWSHLEQDFKR